MTRKFNITGPCIPDKHYMADISEKLDTIAAMVAEGHYFTIHRPRQYGKTTTMFLLEKYLEKDPEYLVLDISFEGIDAPTYNNHQRFISIFLELVKQRLTFNGETQMADFIGTGKNIDNFSSLNTFLAEFILKTGKKTVLMIDEVDKSSNNQLFLDFLGMLRTKFLQRSMGKDVSFHSVILAGVHDVKNLKAKIRPGSGAEDKFNSPWNIAVNFEVDLSLFPGEIMPMLEAYTSEHHVTSDIPQIAEKLFYFTSGYPFLVSNLCKLTDEKILPQKQQKEWTAEDLEKAVQLTLQENNTNFESLIKKLENNRELYDLVYQIIMNEGEVSFNPDNAIIQFGYMYGIFKEDRGKIRIHNRIYEQRIYNYMVSQLETSGTVKLHSVGAEYITAGGGLNIERVIQKFQLFIHEQYSQKDSSFIERNGRLLFLAFLRPIINGHGYDFKEVQVSAEKRLDVVVTFAGQKHIIELKIWRGEQYHKKGIEQLCDYLERQNQKKGYLLVYDLRKETGLQGKLKRIKPKNKEITIAWI